MSQFDFSEYKPDEYEKYNSMMSDNENIIYSFFMNKAFFGKDKNAFQIVVDEHFEHEKMEYLVHSIQEKHPEIHIAYTDDSDEDSDDEKAYNEDMRKTAMSKYDISLDSIDDLKPQINIYSGATINLHYGEGLLDFIYADFETPIKKVYTEERQLELLFERARANKKMADFLNDVSEKSDNGNWNLKPQKIYDEDQLFLNDFEQYELTFNLINEIAYAFLMKDGKESSVIEIFDMLTEGLGLTAFRSIFPVILTDNGVEFKAPEYLEFSSGNCRRTSIFYCDPQASWQKPHVEKNHVLIRRIIPKGTSFKHLNINDVVLLTNHINSVPREIFNNKTPFELITDENEKKLLELLGLSPVAPDDVILKPALLKLKSR